jgi:type IV pilus assembly protein PilB
MTVVVEGSPIDLRVATVPSVWGEEVILRVLDRSSGLLTLRDLGFLEDTLARYEKAFRKPYGAILVVGPTGSGKSTTLYSTLSVVNEVSRKIITVEDPVEFRLEGISQIHVNPKAGLSFATALRSILRSDPDVVMVGEIRDSETARIAIEAAMTGHLVFSTLHTNDAPSAVTRLVEMGVEPFLVASAVECVLAQRLARKLCDRCKVPYSPAPEVLVEAGVDDPDAVFYRAMGCNQCSNTGYRGRVALVELMLVTEDVQKMTVERKSSEEVRRLALAQGMRSLRDDGILKVLAGTTSLEEVLRIVEGKTDESHDVAAAAGGVVPIATKRPAPSEEQQRNQRLL